jgi:hypothetical protein
MRQVWDELGALDGIDIINRDEFVCVEGPSGEQFHWYTKLDRMEKHLKEIAPGDAAEFQLSVSGGLLLGGNCIVFFCNPY